MWRRLVQKRIGQLMAPRDPELLVDMLEVALDGSNRQIHVSSYLLVGATCSGLQGGVELAGCEAHPCGDGSDRRCGGPFTAGQKSRSFLLGGRAIPGLAGAAKEDGRLRLGLRGGGGRPQGPGGP